MKNKTLILFGVLNLVQGALVGAIPLLAPSREAWVNWFLGGAAVLMLIAGPSLIFGGRIGRTLAAIVCLVHGVIGTGFAALVAASASYLYGIYGRHGHAVGSIGFVIVGVVLILFWLIPAHELHYLKKSGSAE